MAESDEQPEQTKTDTPLIYASSIQLRVASNDWSLVLGNKVPVPGEEREELRPKCILQISPQTAKDLYLIIKGALEVYEARYGEIKTEYSSKSE